MTEVPKETVTLTLKTDSLRKLPEGATYHAKNGRAGVEVGRGKEPGTIVVYATCDSLQRLVEYYERKARDNAIAYQSLSDSVRMEKERRSCGWKNLLIAFIAGAATGIITTVITLKKRKRI